MATSKDRKLKQSAGNANAYINRPKTTAIGGLSIDISGKSPTQKLDERLLKFDDISQHSGSQTHRILSKDTQNQGFLKKG